MARTEAFNNKWASNGDKTPFANFVQRARTGWEDGQDKDAPLSGIQNAWQARVDDALQDIERYGAMSYSAAAVYQIGAPTYASDNQFYESITANNTGNDPVTTSGFWRLIGTSLFSTASPGDYKLAAYSTNPPTGWLRAAGQLVSRAMYPRLFSAIGTTYNKSNDTDTTSFRLPDARGMFMRGFDFGRNLDPGRVFGTDQESGNKIHSHTGATEEAGIHVHDVPSRRIEFTGMSGAGGGNAFQNIDVNYVTKPAGAHVHGFKTDANGLPEARPVNITVQVLIKT